MELWDALREVLSPSVLVVLTEDGRGVQVHWNESSLYSLGLLESAKNAILVQQTPTEVE